MKNSITMYKTCSVLLLIGIFSTAFGQNYVPASLSGFNYDLIANGVGPASASSTSDLGAPWTFVSADFKATAGSAAPAYALPASGTVSSTTVTGLNFQLGDYYGNNALRLNVQNQSGILALATPQSGSFVYILGTSGNGATTIDVMLTFTDATTQTFTGMAVNDWYNATTTNLATGGIGRVNRTSNALEGSGTNPHLYHMKMGISSANMGKQISSITITKTDATTAIAAIFAASIDTTILQPCVAPAAQPSNLMLNATANSMGASFTAASPAADKYLVLRTPGTAMPSVTPMNGTQYAAGNTLGNSTVVSTSASATFNDAPLPAGNSYTYTVYAYNDVSCTDAAYNLVAPLQMNASTLPNAVNGDTTWVQAHSGLHLDYYNNFDAPVNFPAGSFRKILMNFTLGKYMCPAGSQYCGDWDYTVTTFLMTPTDTIELARLITPYANASYPRTGWDWKQHYYYDLTDLYPMLQGNATIRILYSGYSGGFTADVKYAFISGTPPRNVIAVQPMWHNSYNYGNSADPIDNHVTPYSLTAPAGTQSAEMKFTITGHGSDNAGCSEFCSKYYQVKQDGNMVDQTTIWKTCGENNLYPQSGTWIYDRGNWCPGEAIQAASHKLNNITAGTNFTADVDFEPYTKSGTGTPSYTIGGKLVYYGDFNKTLDASMEEIIAPSNDENNFRANPLCGKPMIKIRNTGSAAITSVLFEYGVVGASLQTYTLAGMSIAPLDEMTVTLPDLAPLDNMPASSTSQFIATIQQVNGAADQYAINDSLRSTFATAADWPATFNIVLKTTPNSPYYLETSWKIEDLNGAMIAQRNPAAANTTYTDPVTNLAAGCYKFTVTDTDCDGGYWWADNSTKGTTYVVAKDPGGAYLPMTNGLPSFPNTLSQDFGCGYTTYFRVGALIPVELLSFSGKADEKVNHLYWETAQEQNAHHFDVQFSTNGRDFVKVGEMAAKGNSTLKTAYQTTHSPEIAADIYNYRLKMVNMDGSSKFSNVISIKPSAKTFEVSAIAPNPFTNQMKFTITSTKAAPAFIKLYDVHGRVYYKSATAIKTGINPVSINELNKLSGGIYLLEVSMGGEKSVVKVIKD